MARDGQQERAAALGFRQLKLFESVGRLRSVRRGSAECNRSQPAVTQALGKLEKQLGVSLLERRARGSYLTELGRIFHHRVQRMFELMEVAILELGVAGGRPAAAAAANRLSRSQVRGLLAAVEHRTVHAAAHALGLSQASLQRAVRELEGNLRKNIFFRTTQGVVVTPEGIEFGRRLRLATQEVEWGILDIEQARGLRESQIVIGALPFGGAMLLASVLDEFMTAHPLADIRIATEGASEMLRRLRAGDVDLVVGIVQETTARDLSNEVLAHTPFEVVARNDHPLRRKSKVTIDDIAGYDWVVGLAGASRRACFDAMFEGRKAPRSSIATSALPIIRHLLVDSDRLTLMTTYERQHESHVLSAVPFQTPLPAPAVGITMRAEWQPTRLHRDFMQLLRTRISDASLAPGAPQGR
jgi:DNA-binding transcriptional LysR family regulator